MTFTIGEVYAVPKREPGLVFEDDFNNGPAGWVQLVTETNPTGPLVLDSSITHNNSRFSLLLLSGDYPNSAGRVWGGATALKRMSTPEGAKKFYMEFFWSWGSLHGQNTPRAIDFGLDMADKDGLRRLYRYRWLNYDESSSTRVHKWQLHDQTAGFVDIPGADVDCGYNENKRNLFRLEMVFDLEAGVYDGLRVNGIGFGSLAPEPDESLRDYGPEPHMLVPFANGFNPLVDLRNRLNTTSTSAWVNLAYAKGVAL